MTRAYCPLCDALLVTDLPGQLDIDALCRACNITYNVDCCKHEFDDGEVVEADPGYAEQVKTWEVLQPLMLHPMRPGIPVQVDELQIRSGGLAREVIVAWLADGVRNGAIVKSHIWSDPGDPCQPHWDVYSLLTPEVTA